MTRILIASFALVAGLSLSACGGPEVGSEAWCKKVMKMSQKDIAKLPMDEVSEVGQCMFRSMD